MGVEHIWAFDSGEGAAYRIDADGLHPVTAAEMTVPGTAITVRVDEVFSLLPQA